MEVWILLNNLWQDFPSKQNNVEKSIKFIKTLVFFKGIELRFSDNFHKHKKLGDVVRFLDDF